jgi:ATP-dependent helicase HrpA
MLSALAKDIHALTGVRIPPDAWRLDELPTHLRWFFRIVDADGKPIGQGRDLRVLKARFEVSAREVWSRAAKASWEREGITSFNFDSLPERITLQVAGASAFAYPALVDGGDSVALRALSSKQAADQATRAGLRRLFLFHLGETSERLQQLISTSLSITALAAYVAVNTRQLRDQLVERALDETFGLSAPEAMPRTRKVFLDRFEKGRARVQTRIVEMSALSNEVGLALSRVETTLRNLAGKPGAARASLEDAKQQLAALLPKGLFARTAWERLAHLPRYLRAIQVRLERLPNDPRRDADKAAQVVPIWQVFVERRGALRASGVPEEDLERFHWLVEELRVCLFAPELKTVVPVSPQKVAEQWKALAGQRA